MGTMMRRVPTLIAAVILVLVSADRAAAQANPDNVPQVADVLERYAYDECTDQLLTYFWPLMYEIDVLADPPSPEEVKRSPIRKLILDYRLIMDVHAYVYEPGLFNAYRDALDHAYETVGEYKDLFDTQELDGLPINETELKIRLARMNFGLAPLRLHSFREDMKEFAYSRAPRNTVFDEDQIPRLWQLAGTRPRPELDNAGNTAALAQAVLRRLVADGLQVEDILDPVQEDHFHDVRKALRSVLVMTDMYPSLSEQTARRREPLAKLVSAYGKVNDRFIAYRLALATRTNMGERAQDLMAAFEASKKLADDAIDDGDIQKFIDSLDVAIASHAR